MSSLKLLLGVFALVMVSNPAYAEVVLAYDLNGVPLTAPTSVNATTAATGVTGQALSRGAGIAASNLTNGFSSSGWDGAASLASAIADGNYYQFGLSLNSGYRASLSTLDLSLRRSAIAAPMNMQVQASFHDFVTNFAVSSFNYFGRTSGTAPDPDPLLTDPFYYMTNDLAGRPNTTTSPGDAIPTIDLSSVTAFQNLQPGTDVTFRLYAWGTNSASTNTLALGRMTGPSIGGTVTAVPEPGVFALLGTALFCGGLTHRFRKKRMNCC